MHRSLSTFAPLARSRRARRLRRSAGRPALCFLAGVALVAGVPPMSAHQPASGQIQDAGVLEAVPLVLGDGRLALLVEDGGAVVVERILDGLGVGASSAPLDVEQGDRVLGLAGRAGLPLSEIQRSYRELEEGEPVVLNLERGGRGRFDVSFPRPAMVVQVPAGGRRMMMVTEDEAGGGAGGGGEGEGEAASGEENVLAAPGGGQWVSAGTGEEVSTVDVLGWMVRAAEDGRPAVVFRGTHPGQPALALALGDVILAVDGKTVDSVGAFDSLWSAAGPGDRVVLRVERRGRALDVSFVRPEGE